MIMFVGLKHIHTKLKQEQKRKRSKNNQKRSKNKQQTSKKISLLLPLSLGVKGSLCFYEIMILDNCFYNEHIGRRILFFLFILRHGLFFVKI